jgi:hypothetical protein
MRLQNKPLFPFQFQEKTVEFNGSTPASGVGFIPGPDKVIK